MKRLFLSLVMGVLLALGIANGAWAYSQYYYTNGTVYTASNCEVHQIGYFYWDYSTVYVTTNSYVYDSYHPCPLATTVTKGSYCAQYTYPGSGQCYRATIWVNVNQSNGVTLYPRTDIYNYGGYNRTQG